LLLELDVVFSSAAAAHNWLDRGRVYNQILLPLSRAFPNSDCRNSTTPPSFLLPFLLSFHLLPQAVHNAAKQGQQDGSQAIRTSSAHRSAALWRSWARRGCHGLRLAVRIFLGEARSARSVSCSSITSAVPPLESCARSWSRSEVSASPPDFQRKQHQLQRIFVCNCSILQ
jgi:hypothetical protein